MSRFAKTLVVFCFAFTLQGCWGPLLEPEHLDVKAIVSDPVTGVVVSDFYQGEYKKSETRSLDIITLRESMSVQDISFAVAADFSAQRIAARPAAKADVSVLKPGEVLVRGVFNVRPINFKNAGSGIQFFLSCMTLAVYGGVIPYLYPISDGQETEVRIDVIDSKGNILVGHREQVWLYGKTLFLWGTWGKNDLPKAIKPLIREVTSALIKALRISSPSPKTPTTPPKAPTTD